MNLWLQFDCVFKCSKKSYKLLYLISFLHKRWVESIREAGADQYTFHIEATDIPLELCRKIKEAGMKVGIGIKPNTPVKTVDYLVSEADMILIMTVEPGFGGQKFMSDMMSKVRYLRENHPNLNIEVRVHSTLEIHLLFLY